MSGYIHSGVKGKMDRIFKPSPGKILVSDKLGNAVESNKTITNLLSELEEDSKIGNLSNLTTTNKTNLVSAINEINANSGGAEWEWNPVPFYEETLASQFNYNPDLPWYAGKHIDISNSVDSDNKLTHLLLMIERVKPSYAGTPTTRNGSGLVFGLPLLGNSTSNTTQWYYIFGKANTETYGNNVKHFLCITPYHKFIKIKYFFHGYNPSLYAIDTAPLEIPFETILTNDLILYQSDIVISSDLGVGTTIKAYTKKDN